jgi:hypothetical protein
MKKSLLITFLFIAVKVAGQDCNFKDVKARCGNLSATTRSNVYKNHKYKVLNDKNERFEIPYTVSSFFKLLQFTNDVNSSGGPKYDGLRVYFAVNPNASEADFNQLNLIFVPTTEQPDKTHLDDLGSCWIIKQGADAPVRITAPEASSWVRKFQDGSTSKYAKLDGDGKHRKGKKFEEAKSLWYSAAYLGNDSKGLLYFFNCKKNKVTSIAVRFGGFGGLNQYNYRLTLLFKLSFENKDKYSVTFTRSNNKQNLKETSDPKFLYKSGDGTVDTGVPCPPPPTGQTCPGALLPQ